MHLFLVTGGCLCAGSGQSLRVQFDHALCCGTSLLELEDPLVMLLCYNMLDHVVRNLLVLVLFKLVPFCMSYDVISVEISTSIISARLYSFSEQCDAFDRPKHCIPACQIWEKTVKSLQSY